MEGVKVWLRDSEFAWVKGEVVMVMVEEKGEGETRVQVRRASAATASCHIAAETTWISVTADDGFGGGGGGDTLPLQNDGIDDVGYTGVDDMCSLNYLHEPALLNNLSCRHQHSLPYTYTGDVCLAVNPYEWIEGLYAREKYAQYLECENARRELPPHPFATSASAFRRGALSGFDQSILVSGESGAGKTETVKILLRHLAFLGTSGACGGDGGGGGGGVVARILEANPLLEAFGNAKTIRNDNSSRFGKFQQLVFAESQLVGSECRTYLLEKSRVVQHAEGERNYHIFYQLLSTTDQDLRRRLRLPSDPAAALSMRFMGSGRGGRFEAIEGRTDEEQFDRTRRALDVLGIDEYTVSRMMEALSGVLHLGQVEFDGDADKSQVAPAGGVAAGEGEPESESKSESRPSPIDTAASLLQVEPAALASALVSRTVVARNESFAVPLSCEDAASSRDALAKAIYARLFEWLVRRINRSTSIGVRGGSPAAATASAATGCIGLLDIFGFECLQRNSFEQLCINFTNEKLQQKFTRDVFKTVQAEYEEEGVPWTRIAFRDNEPILSMIEGRGDTVGILSLLDEECLRPKGDDLSLVNKIAAIHGDHPNFSRARLVRTGFKIVHFAGPVDYDAVDFLEKNRDSLQNDLVSLVQTSHSPLLGELFNPPEAAADGTDTRRRRRPSMAGMATVGNEFKRQLAILMDKIKKTEVQYVRCLKPNSLKRPDIFDRNGVVDQLRCAGVIAAVRISRAAFPCRLPIADFVRRFWMLTPSLSCRAASGEDVSVFEHAVGAGSRQEVGAELCREALDLIAPREMEGGGGEVGRPARQCYFVAKTKIFFGHGVLEEIESKRTRVVCSMATAIQSHARGARRRRWYRRWGRGLRAAQASLRGHLARRMLTRIRNAAVVAQSFVRGSAARLRATTIRRVRGATIIQAHLRGITNRYWFRLALASIVRIQSQQRCRIARRRKNEAREQAKLENQIAMLKSRLREEEDSNRRLADELRERSVASPPPAVRSEDVHKDAQQMIDTLHAETGRLRDENAALKLSLAEMSRALDGQKGLVERERSRRVALQQEHTRLQKANCTKKEILANVKAEAALLKNDLRLALDEKAVLRGEVDDKKKEVDQNLRDFSITIGGIKKEFDLLLKRSSPQRGNRLGQPTSPQQQQESLRAKPRKNNRKKKIGSRRKSEAENRNISSPAAPDVVPL